VLTIIFIFFTQNHVSYTYRKYSDFGQTPNTKFFRFSRDMIE